MVLKNAVNDVIDRVLVFVRPVNYMYRTRLSCRFIQAVEHQAWFLILALAFLTRSPYMRVSLSQVASRRSRFLVST